MCPTSNWTSQIANHPSTAACMNFYWYGCSGFFCYSVSPFFSLDGGNWLKTFLSMWVNIASTNKNKVSYTRFFLFFLFFGGGVWIRSLVESCSVVRQFWPLSVVKCVVELILCSTTFLVCSSVRLQVFFESFYVFFELVNSSLYIFFEITSDDRIITRLLLWSIRRFFSWLWWICRVWGLKVTGKGQGCVAVRYLTPYFGYFILPPRWFVGAQESP